MLPLYKLDRLPAGHRRRKILLALTGIEKESVVHGACSINQDYLIGLVRLALQDPKLDGVVVSELEKMLCGPSDENALFRLCNYTRHALLAAVGTFPAEWDLILPDQGEKVSSGLRSFFPGVCVYAEDIRSPFNLGSIFRTAEAFGAEKILISPLCVPPSHPRAQRSAMGCIDFIPWEQISLESLPSDIPVFALETGGIPLDEFEFPTKGIVIIGSEELGISSEGLSRATYGRVSIPMTGIKASLNVGVAFGILMQAWTSYLFCSEPKPFSKDAQIFCK